MLTNTDIYDTYNKYLIKDMIADERTLGYYRSGITGYKVAECNFYKYSDTNLTITMNYPIFPHQVMLLELWFTNEKLYKVLKFRLMGKKHDGVVVVFGEWKNNKTDDIKYVKITSQKQIAVIKKES